jgi:hypothetical protein
LIQDCADKQVRGRDTRIEIDAFDECNKRIDTRKLAKSIKAADAGFVGLVGVQSNQYPRALDLGRRFRAEGVPVVIGGFHVSGTLAMISEIPADLQEALDLGITLFAGEAETRMANLLSDIGDGQLKPSLQLFSRLTGAG